MLLNYIFSSLNGEFGEINGHKILWAWFCTGLSSFLGYTTRYYKDSLSSKNVAVVGLLLKPRKKNLIETFSFDELTHGQGG